jgi:hypothetical protein
MPPPPERKTTLWRFVDTVERRAWNARRWSSYRPAVGGTVATTKPAALPR